MLLAFRRPGKDLACRPRYAGGLLPAVRILAVRAFGIGCEYDVPEDVFMVLELQPGFLERASGTVKIHAVFKEAG
jgi:hypothetical protein